VKGKEYVCMSAHHSFVSDSYGSGAGGGDEFSFTGQYDMMSTDVPLAPPRKTAVPVVRGLQTATVVGEGEIDCDEHGRIRVHFPWDLEGVNSMRCRVSQNWASGGWGGMIIPRIGMEVIVDYVEGHPDKPIVTGCVFNGKNKPIYELPTHKTRSTFRTDSHESDGYNELRFEDKTSAEEIFIHAQRNRNELTLANHAEQIKANWSQTVEGKRAVEVSEDATQVVGGALNMYIGAAVKDHVHNVGKENGNSGKDGVDAIVSPSAVSGPGNMSLVMEDSLVQTIGKNSTVSIGADSRISIGNNSTEEVGVDSDLKVRRTFSTHAGTDINKTAGRDVTIKAGKILTLEGGDKVIIKSGKSKIVLSKNGDVLIEGKAFQLKTSATTSIKAGGAVKVKGSKIDLN